MDEMDIVRKVTHLFYMFRRDSLLKKRGSSKNEAPGYYGAGCHYEAQ